MHVGMVSLAYYPMSMRTYMIETCTACRNDTDRRAARGQLTCSRRMSERALGPRIFVQVPGTPPIESRLAHPDDGMESGLTFECGIDCGEPRDAFVQICARQVLKRSGGRRRMQSGLPYVSTIFVVEFCDWLGTPLLTISGVPFPQHQRH
jgi:hypothetical protein